MPTVDWANSSPRRGVGRGVVPILYSQAYTTFVRALDVGLDCGIGDIVCGCADRIMDFGSV